MSSVLTGFVIGVASSIVATGILALRRRYQLRMSFRAVLSNVVKLSRQISTDGYQPDHLIAIDRSGGIVASIMAGSFGLHPTVSVGTSSTRREDGRRETAIDPVFRGSLELLRDKSILVVTCINDTGTSLGHVVDYLRDREHPPAEIRTAALYTTISPSFRPQYAQIEVGRDTKASVNRIRRALPWVTKDWIHHLADERHA